MDDDSRCRGFLVSAYPVEFSGLQVSVNEYRSIQERTSLWHKLLLETHVLLVRYCVGRFVIAVIPVPHAGELAL